MFTRGQAMTTASEKVEDTAVSLAIAGGIGGISYVSAAMSIFCFSVAMLALGQTIGGNFTRARSVPRVLRYPMSGNAVLALAGILMLGYNVWAD
jgi:putative Mn2+ efflux pump MntP